jgi:hypothetical protein
MRRVKLWGLSGAALIVPQATNVVYENQVNGTACYHKELEGILIPLNNDCLPSNHHELLECYLTRFFEQITTEFDENDINNFNKLLHNFPETTGVRVNEAKIDESYEAWIHVVVEENSFSDFSGFGRFEAVLTWCNGD